MHKHKCPICRQFHHCADELGCFKGETICGGCRRDNLVMFAIIGGVVILTVIFIAVTRSN